MQAAIAYLCCRQYECPLKAGFREIQHDEDTHVRFSPWSLTPKRNLICGHKPALMLFIAADSQHLQGCSLLEVNMTTDRAEMQGPAPYHTKAQAAP